MFVDIESHDARSRFTMPPDVFFRLGGLSRDHQYTVSNSYESFRRLVSTSSLLVGHNVVSFDVPALGFDVLSWTRDRRVFDTMIAASLVDPSDAAHASRSRYSLAAATRAHGLAGKTGDLLELSLLHGGFGGIPVDDPEYLEYLRGDVLAVESLYRKLVPLVPDDEYLWREHRVHAVCSQVQSVGLLVDQDRLRHRVAEAAHRRTQLVNWLIREHDVPTVTSTGEPAAAPHATAAGKRALVAAFENLGVHEQYLPLTPTGEPSFSADALADIASQYPQSSGLCEAIGALVGVRSVYDTVDTYVHDDGRVHPRITLFQASGRTSVTRPGLTVLGKHERDVFVASPGHVLVSADLSQVDARCVAAHSGDREYAKLFEPGVDAHEVVARMAYGDATYDSDPARYRKTAKIISHGVNYSMGVLKLADSAGVRRNEAQRVVDTIATQFPRLAQWKREVREEAESGNLLDNGFGRRMRPVVDRSHTQAPALYGQGTARDVLFEAAAIRMPLDIQRMTRALVHDEAVWEIPEADVADVCAEIERAFCFEWAPPGDRGQPIRFEAACSRPAHRWSELY